jgi:hypothetical protein
MKRLALALCLLAAGAQAQTPPVPPASSVPIPPAVAESWLPRPIAELAGLDKITARQTPLYGKVGETLSFGSLRITVRACLVRGPDQPPDQAVFLDVTDTRAPDFHFASWMLLSDPALAVLEHPVYDVKLVSCHTS